MLKLPSLVLAAAALAGRAAAQTGCFPAYRSGVSYAEGDWVSATVFVTDAPALRGKATPAPKTFNFRCSSKFFCPNVGYAPEGQYGSLAWDQADEPCSGTADPPSLPVPEAWSGGGCPAKFSPGAEYGSGEVASVCTPGQAWCMVYKCKNANPAPGKFCGAQGYEPGQSLYWDVAWDVEGSCEPGAPVAPSAIAEPWSGGGCPPEFSTSAEYGGGDVVSVCDETICMVYKCKNDLPAPGKFCDKQGYEPGQSLYWEVAWDVEGSCSGPFQDVSVVSHEVLQDVGKCPGKYAAGPEKYSAGDRVSKDGKVFQCKEWPYERWCSQAGYEPLVSAATPNAWKYAWDIVGRCSGTIDTIADAAEAGVLLRTSFGVCDDAASEYRLGTKYSPGELATVCTHKHFCTVYRCAMDMPHPSRWCGQAGYTPGSGSAWTMAWTEEGYCTTTATPTASPTSSPSNAPSISAIPSQSPTASSKPSLIPSHSPSMSDSPSSQPSANPSSSHWPSSQPSEVPSTSASPSTSTVPSSAPTCSGAELDVDIFTDYWAWETSWQLLDMCTGQVVLEEEAVIDGGSLYGDSHTAYSNSYCVPKSLYELVFVIGDTWGDGQAGPPNGNYTVKYDGVEVASGEGAFGTEGPFLGDDVHSETSPIFGDPCPSSAPSVSAQPSSSQAPSWNPTHYPTSSPTKSPTESPTTSPTESPTKSPTESPTKNPTDSPTQNPTQSPTKNPTESPTKNPTESPTKNPTESPTKNPTESPTKSPTEGPTKNPTKSPTPPPTPPPTPSLVCIRQPGNRCANVCLVPVTPAQCPSNPNIQQCYGDLTQVGQLCEGDGECGTSDSLNNCWPGWFQYDIYRRVACSTCTSFAK